MVDTLQFDSQTEDLAGSYYPALNYTHLHHRINILIDRYLSLEHLHDRLQELPHQFEQPQPRPWKAIDWHAIHPEQIIGIDFEVFLSILIGSIDTEAPIRQYTQVSRQYLQNLHPQMARFVGGIVAEDGTLLEPGLWEKEERQHTPALLKIYAQLTGDKATLTLREVRSYQTSTDPRIALYRHGLHRIATEYGATCLYLWLMANTTGALQAVLEELAKDEINHMTKFWGFGVWAYPESSFTQIGLTLLTTARGRMTYSRDRSSLIGTLHRMMDVLGWQSWTWLNRTTFAFTCSRALLRLLTWNRSLKPTYLQAILGKD